MHRGKTMREHRQLAAMCRLKREASGEINPVDTLALDH